MNRSVCGSFVVVLSLASSLFADLPGAQKYLEQAKQQVAGKEQNDRIETSLKLAEAELDGVGAAEKDAINKEIAAIRTQMKASENEALKSSTVRELDRMFKTAESSLGIRQTGINDQFTALDKLLSDAKTIELLGAAEVDKYRKQLTTFRKVSDDKMRELDVAAAQQLVESVEKAFPELINDLKTGSPASQEGAASTFQRRLDEFKTNVKDLPKDLPAIVDLTARMEKLRVQVDDAYGKKQVAEALDRLKRNWEIGLEEIQGWETETVPAKFADMVKQSSQAMSKLGAPKTAEAASRARRFLASLAENEQAKPYVGISPLKEFVDSITKLKNDTEAKLVGFATGIVTEAEQSTLTRDARNRLESLVNDDLRLTLEGHPQLAALQQRGLTAVAKFDQTAAAGEAAMSGALEEAKKDAAARWPTLVKDVAAVEGFDPAKASSYVGKTIRLPNVYNRLGWDYGADRDFDFAMAVDGKPLAARYSPEVKAAIAEVNKKTGTEGLPEETPYDLIAVYTGDIGTLQKREQREAKITGDIQGTVTGEVKVPVEAPVLTIVGLYCGPVAVYSPSAAGAATAAGVSGGGGWMARLVGLFVMLLAGLVVLLKAQFAPVAGLPQLGGVRANMTPRNLSVIGVLFLALGLLWLVRGYVYYGLLGNLALAAAGLYLALDLFEGQSWWKPDVSAKLRLLAVPIGLACAGIGIARLILGGTIAFL